MSDTYYENGTRAGSARELNEVQERELTEDTKTLLKARLIDSEFQPTSDGHRELIEILRKENRQKLVARAKEILAEFEKNK